MPFKKVQRKVAKLRAACTGPSGSGKTLSSLYLAFGFTNDWNKIALIDTEHGRAQFYANRSDLGTGEFLYDELTPPYSPERYIEKVKEAASVVGSDGVIIVDSFSHAWDNEGGILDLKTQLEKSQNKNSFTVWNEAGKIQNNLVNTLLSVECHVRVTLRSKMAYAMEQNERGKMEPVKLGLAPVQRENTEYEFDIVFNISRNHYAVTSKDTTFLDTWNGMITPELGSQLKEWLSNGAEPHRCADCGSLITAVKGRSVEQIAEGTEKNYGRKLCWKCMSAEIKRIKEQKQNETETVSK